MVSFTSVFELRDLNRAPSDFKKQEETATAENDRFQIIFIIMLLYILLVISGSFG
jgi:hypothetical protein